MHINLKTVATAAAASVVLVCCSPGDQRHDQSSPAQVRAADGVERLPDVPTDPSVRLQREENPKLWVVPEHWSPAARARQQRVVALFRTLSGGDEISTADTLLVEARRRLQDEINACPDDKCRISRLNQQIARLRFATGQGGRLSPLPWERGLFSSDPVNGLMWILPMGGREIFVWIVADGDEGRWICNIRATGLLNADGGAILTMHYPPATRPARFVLRTFGPARIGLRRPGKVEKGSELSLYAADDDQYDPPLSTACGVGGSFLGDYVATKSRAKPA